MALTRGRLQICVQINICALLPSFGGVGGGQNEEVLKYDISLFFLPNFLLLNLFDV